MQSPNHVTLVIGFLGTVMLASLAAITTLAYAGRTIPDVLVALASGALSALAALLVNVRDEQRPGRRSSTS